MSLYPIRLDYINIADQELFRKTWLDSKGSGSKSECQAVETNSYLGNNSCVSVCYPKVFSPIRGLVSVVVVRD